MGKKRDMILFFASLTIIAFVIGSFDFKNDEKLQEAKQNMDFEKYTESIEGTDVSFTMMPIPEGEFTIGSPEAQENREEDEGPQKNVKMDAFYMMETELTWDLYELFIDKDKSATLSYSLPKI
jgi:formylglycine-generating enzyme required for sulfatase activity